MAINAQYQLETGWRTLAASPPSRKWALDGGGDRNENAGWTQGQGCAILNQ